LIASEEDVIVDLGGNLILTKSDLVPESKLVVGEFWKGDGRNKGQEGVMSRAGIRFGSELSSSS